MLECKVGLRHARLVIILVEAFAILAPKPSCVDHALKKDARPILRVPSTGIEGFLNGEASVEADTRDWHKSVTQRDPRNGIVQVS
jgi:hypothetical protein